MTRLLELIETFYRRVMADAVWFFCTFVVAGLAAAMLVFFAAVAFANTPDPGPNAGKRIVVVTERIDQPGRHESIPHTFIMGDQDRLYVTRHDAYLVHTDTGQTEEVEFQGTPIGFGNVTVSRVQR